MNGKVECRTCLVCKKSFPLKNMIPMGTVRKVITEEIAQDFPESGAQDYICQTDLTKYRMQVCTVNSELRTRRSLQFRI
jgi:hypothetical protein